MERSGLFLKIDGGDRYQFPHLTLQEYFAAVALTDNPRQADSVSAARSHCLARGREAVVRYCRE